jgi:uncharacterized protein
MKSPALMRLADVLAAIGPRIVACSGGIDSMLLATVAHRAAPDHTIMAHAISAAVPREASERVRFWAAREFWNLEQISSGEFEDEQYLSNPLNRCYFCKSHLYTTLADVKTRLQTHSRTHTLLSGANLDDLGEYRPGLQAAAEWSVRHPFIEAQSTKADIRAMARDLGLPFAEIPASPCLASRLYTGTRVTASRLRAVEAGEALIRRAAQIDVVRCRVREQQLLIEVCAEDRSKITTGILDQLVKEVGGIESSIATVALDPKPYRSGRAFVPAPAY